MSKVEEFYHPTKDGEEAALIWCRVRVRGQRREGCIWNRKSYSSSFSSSLTKSMICTILKRPSASETIILDILVHLLMRFSAPETAWGQTVVFSFAWTQEGPQQRLSIQRASAPVRVSKPESILGVRACGF